MHYTEESSMGGPSNVMVPNRKKEASFSAMEASNSLSRTDILGVSNNYGQRGQRSFISTLKQRKEMSRSGISKDLKTSQIDDTRLDQSENKADLNLKSLLEEKSRAIIEQVDAEEDQKISDEKLLTVSMIEEEKK